MGCGSGGGGPTGGSADLFPCDSPWYRDVTTLPVAPQSDSILSVISNAGGWGLSNHFQIDFGAALLHANSGTQRREVWIQPKDASDRNAYYPGDSDLVSPGRGWSVPTPSGGHLEGNGDYHCPQVNGVNQADCHLTVVDDARHLLIELYGASLDDATGRWYATQESVWNLGYHYSPRNQRGYGCTSADAAGLPISAGVIGLRETRFAATDNGVLRHALRFILPNDRTRRAFVSPASHTQGEAMLTSGGPPYGVRLRLKPGFDESRVRSPGARVIVHTLKRYGMILADGGQIILSADDEGTAKAQDPSLTWSGLLSPLDLDGLQVSDFDVVDYDESTLSTGGPCNVDRTPLVGLSPQGRHGPRLKRHLRR